MLRLAMDFRDTTLPQMARNIIGDSEYKGERKYSSRENANRLIISFRVARYVEENFEKYGFVVPYYGARPNSITRFIQPQTRRFAASYNMELGEDFTSMYGPDDAFQELVDAMGAEIVAELDHILRGRDVLYCPCLCPVIQSSMDANTLQKMITFSSIHYLVNAKSIDSFMRYFQERSPQVRNHEPSDHFMRSVLPFEVARCAY